MTIIVMIIQILQNATMMEVIVVDLMSTHMFAVIVYATHIRPVMDHLNWYQMDTAMMQPTMQAAILMVVTAYCIVMVLLIWFLMDTVMMKPTMWTAILMEVNAVDGVLIQSTVQIVSVIQSHQLFLSAMVILIKICACKLCNSNRVLLLFKYSVFWFPFWSL